jgi:ElaB/YqjD/DUF883 family membrane-anchored ribosome-binding protein
MFRQSGYFRAISADIGEIDRRLRALEKTLTRAGGRASASAGEAADRLGETVANALSTIADRFRNGAGSLGDEAAKFGGEAAKLGAKYGVKYGNEAFRLGTRYGNDAMHRLADEVERRPLVTLAVAVGVGILVGLASHRR